MLAAMLAFYVLTGLFGRDPWKGEDAIHIGTAWQMLTQGSWLLPELAGRPFHEAPLYYWTAAFSGQIFGSLFALHDAIRLASGFWVALALTGLYYAGRELYGQESAAASPLLLAGSVGLMIHAHDAQPMLVALAAYTAGLGALAVIARKPRLTGLFYGLALAACFLGVGPLPTLPLLLLGPVAVGLSNERRQALKTLLLGLALAVVLATPWPLWLFLHAPERFAQWWAIECAGEPLTHFVEHSRRLAHLLPWFAFPALPLAAWTLWLRRRRWRETPHSLPLIFFLITAALLPLITLPGEIPLLLLLPSLALMATPGALALRRGAANAFDWFAMTTFSLFAALTWLAWSAMALGWPEKLARRVVTLRPGFMGEIGWPGLAAAVLVSVVWLWLIVTAPRSPYRSLIHWTLGFTTFWMLAVALILPWFDYGKSYRPVAQAIARLLPDSPSCVAERNLTDTQRASLAYFAGIEPFTVNTPQGQKCRWLLVTGDTPPELAAPGRQWHKVWEGSRPGDKREKFRLYRREESKH